MKIEKVSKSFGGIQALDKLSFILKNGMIASLIGPNGAGKTTLFNIITGSIPPDSGKIEFLGRDITNLKLHETCRIGIARTYQKFNVFPNLNVFENIYAGTLKEKKNREEREERVHEILESLGLLDKADQSISELSPLDIKLTELGRSLATNPKLILLDELVGGLTGKETDRICEFLKSLNKEGYTILQIGHEMGPIMDVSKWIYVLNKGSLIAEGPPEKVKNDKRVLEVYLKSGGE